MTLHTYTPNEYSYQLSRSCTSQFLRYSPDKLLPTSHPPMPLDAIGENNTPTALKSCWVRMVVSVALWLVSDCRMEGLEMVRHIMEIVALDKVLYVCVHLHTGL